MSALKMKKETHSTGYHLLRSDPVLADELEEPPESTQEEESAEDKAAATDQSPLWKAVVNLISDIEGTGLLALPCHSSEWNSGHSSYGSCAIYRLLHWSNLD